LETKTLVVRGALDDVFKMAVQLVHATSAKPFSTGRRIGLSPPKQARHWQYVKLSQAQEKKLREMIIRGSPGEPWQFGCRIVALKHEGKVIPITSTPVPANGMGSECYTFVIAGMVWYFFVSDSPLKNHEK